MSVDTDGFAATSDDGVRAANKAPSAWRLFIAQYLAQPGGSAAPDPPTNSRPQPIAQCAWRRTVRDTYGSAVLRPGPFSSVINTDRASFLPGQAGQSHRGSHELVPSWR